MRATIRKDNVKIEFSGRGQIWNDLLRPYLGGPAAPPEPDRPAAHAPAPAHTPPIASTPAAVVRPAATVQFTSHRAEIQVQPAPVAAAPRPAAATPRTWYPPRPAQTQQRTEPPQHYSAEEGDGDFVEVEPSSDPATLYARLADIPGRRSERDAILAAVWFLTKGEHETTADDVETHFQALHVFPDVKVTPHLLKHVHRTKMLEQGSGPKAVTLSKKGLASVRGRLVPV